MNPFEESPPQISKEELQIYKDWFIALQFSATGSIVDTSVVLKPDALFKYLASSELPSPSLSKVWDLAGGTVKGGLGISEFQIACKLIALAQAGLPIALDHLGKKTNTAKFSIPLAKNIPGGNGPTAVEGFSTSGRILSIGPTSSSSSTAGWMPVQRTGASIKATPTGSFQGLICSPEEKAKFTSFFESSGPVDGFLAGNVAKDIFLKSQLPPEMLGKIWTLIDKDGLGKFSLNLFCVGMWIITKIKTGLLKEVPRFIPSSLWNSITAAGTGNTVPASSPLKATSLSTNPATITSMVADMTDAEKTQYKSYFESLDSSSKGTLTGSECSSVFLKSKLPGSDLALIWDLVDTKKSGSIDREQFAIAMHIIKKKIGGYQLPLPSTGVASNGNQGAPASLLDFSTPSLPLPASSKLSSVSKQSDADLLQGLSMATNLPDKSFSPSLPASMTPLPQVGTSTNSIMMPKQTLPQSAEIRDLETKENNLKIRHQELNTYQSQLQDLKPNAEEIKKKREMLDLEYRSVTERRNHASIELSQLRADYELDLETMRDRQSMLASDYIELQAAQTTIARFKEEMAAIKKENENLAEKIDIQKKELVIVLKTVAGLESETAKLRQATHQIFNEAQQQQTQMDYHSKILESGKQEHDIVKKNLELEQGRLEADKKKVLQLEQQASVQHAIIEKEKLRVDIMERERLESVKKSQELLGSIQSMDAATSKKAKCESTLPPSQQSTSIEQERNQSLREQILATAVSSEEIVFPIDEAAPPIPPASTKPLKSSLGDLSEDVPEPESTVPICTTTSGSAIASATLKTPASVISVESINSKKERDAMDLDSLLSSNKPKSEMTPKLKATPVVPPPSSSIVDFDSTHSTTTPATGKSKPPPPPTSSSGNVNLVGTPSKNDDASLMEKAFANATLKQAKDTPSLTSEAILGSMKPPASFHENAPSANQSLVNDSFSFNATFGSNSTSSSSKKPVEFTSDSFSPVFKTTGDVDFGDFKSSFPTNSANLAQQDLDSVFGSASLPSSTNNFKNNDPFGSSGTNDPFGGFGNNPFDVFNTPFPPPTSSTSSIPVAAKSPTTTDSFRNQSVLDSNGNGFQSSVPLSKEDNATEVAKIMSMGFTREQALTSLEAHGWNLARAINYLIESASV